MSEKSEFQGVIAETVDDSIPWWPVEDNKRKDAPNVVLIMLDDLGFGQLGCYGSTVDTPNIDKLAEEGLRYNNFHTTAMCSPSRASLLTGRNPHSAGVSFVTEVDNGFPNGRGKVRKDTALISEMLLEEGYNTFAVGKWHLAPAKEQKFTGPFDGWPLGRGFEHYYGFMRGATDQFYPELVEGNKRVPQPKSPEEGYHLTEDLTDKAIEYIKMQKSEEPDKPFFCYLSYAAPHAPHQAPQEYIEKYKGKFDKGWDQVREEWFLRQKELGIIPQNAVLPPSNPGVKPWAELEEDEKQLFARMQEAFAGFLEHTDYHIGRFIQCLEELGQIDNTLVIFLSDNGACGMGGGEGMLNNWTPTTNAIPETFESKLARLEEIGGPNAKSHYPAGWAQAGNTPLRWYKTFTHAGGVRCPLIISYPKLIKDKGGIRTQYHHITDIVPTILELIDAKAPEVYKGVPQKPIYGTSLLYTLEETDAPTRKKVQHYEIVGNRGIWMDGWKAVARHVKGTSFDEDVWELYDAQNDFSEINNLAETYPEKLKELVSLWWQEAEKYDVFPLDGRSIAEKLERKPSQNGPIHRTYYAESALFNSLTAPDLRDKSFKIQAELDRTLKENGVIVAHGDKSGGYSLFIKDNYLIFHYNMSNVVQMTIKSEKELPSGPITIEFLLIKTIEDQGFGKLVVNGEIIGEGTLSYISVLGFSKSLFCIGKLEGGSMSPEFESPFEFEGNVKKVTYTLGGYEEDLEAHVREELFSE
ncbi:sulfatase-like hydrolase/transferase [Bacillus sp. Marseille-P3661]|uniref:sulfatase-like hydrolase/transferase n=1 Tax=Bacillus sp. Marseille-P3661 TaxID=1936234 RepID=UPI0015E18DAE|nr:sulfatase-like hydrolase/transferase [Bacillus sp. Marseille-P3661]